MESHPDMEDIKVEDIFNNFCDNIAENGFLTSNMGDKSTTSQMLSVEDQIFCGDDFLKFLEGDYLNSTENFGEKCKDFNHMPNPSINSSTNGSFSMYSVHTNKEPDESMIYEILDDDSNYLVPKETTGSNNYSWTSIQSNEINSTTPQLEPGCDSKVGLQSNVILSTLDSSTLMDEFKIEDRFVVITDLDTLEPISSTSADCINIPSDGERTILDLDTIRSESKNGISTVSTALPENEVENKEENQEENRDEIVFVSEGQTIRRSIVTQKPMFSIKLERDINQLLREIDEMQLDFPMPYGPKIKKPRKLQTKLCLPIKAVVKKEVDPFNFNQFNDQQRQNTLHCRPYETVEISSSDESDEEPNNSSQCEKCGKLYLYNKALKTHRRKCSGISERGTNTAVCNNNVNEQVRVKDEQPEANMYAAYKPPTREIDVTSEIQREPRPKNDSVTLRRSQRILTKREDRELTDDDKIHYRPVLFREAVQPFMLEFVEEDVKPPKIKKTEYVCDSCGRKYVQKGRFETHMKNHKDLICVFCTNSFGLRSEYNNHMKRCGKPSRRKRLNP